MQCSVAAQWHLLFCQKLDGQLSTLPTCLLAPCTLKITGTKMLLRHVVVYCNQTIEFSMDQKKSAILYNKWHINGHQSSVSICSANTIPLPAVRNSNSLSYGFLILCIWEIKNYGTLLMQLQPLCCLSSNPLSKFQTERGA